MGDQVVLLDFWPSPYGMRAKVALAEKGIKYEAKEEKMDDKSALLLESNPVHKLIPVLIHKGKPVCESLNVVEYIDEVWNHKSPLLSSHPYERARAKFWAHYADNKLFAIGRTVWMAKGEDQNTKEFIECLKTLEAELGEKPYFGGESFGFVDVAIVPITCWFYSFEICAGFNIESECPKLVEWAKRCMKRESVVKSLADPQKIHGYALFLREKYGL